ncbi:major facilitator superfamily domain-containing protein [Gorgonomyces haynaldii]|nr:major facilitator superfamily domain-containing protein [Gorgonomyces haynaldii]
MKKSSDQRSVQEVLHDAIEQVGMGRYQWQLFALCGLGWAADNMYLQALAVIQPPVQKEFHLTTGESGFLGTATLGGMLFGALFWGFVSDAIGRRPAFMITLAWTAVFATATAFAPNLLIASILLGLMGFGVGGNLPVDGALFLEFTPVARQSLLTLLSLFWPVGQVISSILGVAILPSYSCTDDACPWESNKGWRIVQFVLGLLTFLMVIARVLLFTMYESPKFLVSQKRYAEAVHVLKEIAAKNGSKVEISVQDFEDALDETPERKESVLQRFKESVKPLFTKELLMTTIVVWLIWSFVALGYNIFNGFLPKFLQSSGGAEQELSIFETYRNYMIISVCGIPGSILGMYLSETKLGRKGTMAIATFATSACLFLFIVFKDPIGQLVSACVEGFTQNIMYGVIYAYTPEVFPTRVRGKGVGIASALGRITGAIAPTLTGYLLDINVQIPLYVSASFIALTGVCMLLLPIETRGKVAQ